MDEDFTDAAGFNLNPNEEPLLAVLVQELHEICLQGNYEPQEAIDLDKARNVLEATAGETHLAAQLYWDDFLATQAQQRRPPPQERGEEPAEEEPQDEDNDNDDDMPDVIGPNNNDNVIGNDNNNNDDAQDAGQAPPVIQFDDEETQDDRRRGLRRSLERDFDRNVDPANEEQQQEQQDVQEEENPVRRANVERIIEHARRAVRNLRQQHHQGFAAMAARVLAAQEGDDDNNNNNDLVSISDDEAAAGRRNAVGLAKRRGAPSDDQGTEDTPSRKRRKLEQQQENEETEPDPNVDGYLSDNDWLWESLVSRTSIPLCAPVDVLWGLTPTTVGAATNRSTSSALAPTAAAAAAANDPPSAGDEASSNVIADDECDPADTGNERTGIPRTWLGAGFHLSECTSGLVLKAPSEDDITYFLWRQQTSGNGNSRNAIPPPYHCRAISGLLSIVTALLYTGAAISNNHVTCGAVRKPFVELNARERKRDFETRLADALSSLLLIAAKASLQRKRKFLTTLQKSTDPANKRKWQKLERKLKLCPTCSWETDPSTGEVRLPEGRDSDRNIQVQTSYTNIQDLRAYVVSNMNSFTSSGGCALFLETLLRIHGRGAVLRMVRSARKQAGLPESRRAMIHCTCEERHKKEMEANPKPMRSRRDVINTIDTTPPGHECIKIELMSLLLTGRVYSTLKGWSSGPLGVGMLSNVRGEIGSCLLRPEQPVWILRGPTCYSVLVLNGNQDHAESFSRIDQPGAVSELMHWNCWYGANHNNKTILRLVTGRGEWNPPKPCKRNLLDLHPHHRVDTMTAIVERRRLTRRVTVEQEQSEATPPELQFTKEEMERVQVNPDDQKFYPNKYRMWRYDMMTDCDDNMDQKPRAERWTPFHRLSKREQWIVEAKLGPQIKTILWTRWPRATIDNLDPPEPAPVV